MHMQDNQTLYVAGGFDEPITDTAWYIRVEGGNKIKQLDPAYICNAEETDTRLWLHVKNSAHTKFVVLSPDTDVYHIGPHLQRLNEQVIVQVSPINTRELKHLNMTALSTALLNNPDLVHIEPSKIPQVMQTLFVGSGCDYTSFFSQIGKATYFFQHANFITGKDTPDKGTLADIAIKDEYTQIAAVALPPSTTHPLPWVEQHTQEHTHELAPKCILHVFTCTFTDLPRLSNLPLLCPSAPVTPPRSPTED